MTSSPSWYDLLGVTPSATPEQIKAAWRDATDKFEPGTGATQFRLFSEAADVLLDPVRRAAYDAEIGVSASVPDQNPEEVPEEAAGEAAAEEPAAQEAEVAGTDLPAATELPAYRPEGDPTVAVPPSAPGAQRSAGLKAGVIAVSLLCVLAIGSLVLAGVLASQVHTKVQTFTGGDDAKAAASRALTAVLSYDYRNMDADAQRSAAFLTPAYRKQYLKTFALLTTGPNGTPGGAVQTKAVVTADVLDTGVVDAEPGRVRVIAFVNQSSVKGSGTPAIFQNRVVVTMVQRGDAWLVDNITSY